MLCSQWPLADKLYLITSSNKIDEEGKYVIVFLIVLVILCDRRLGIMAFITITADIFYNKLLGCHSMCLPTFASHIMNWILFLSNLFEKEENRWFADLAVCMLDKLQHLIVIYSNYINTLIGSTSLLQSFSFCDWERNKHTSTCV